MKISRPKDLLKINGPWFHKQFNAYPLTLGSVATGAAQYAAKFLPYFQKYGVCFYTKSIADWYWNRREQLRVRGQIINAQLKDSRFITLLNNSRHKEFLLLKKELNYFYKLDLKKLTNKELWNAYTKVLNPLYHQWGWGMMSEPFLGTGEDWFADELRPDLEVKFGSKWLSILSVLGLPNKPSFVNDEHNSLLNIAVDIFKNKKVLKEYKVRGLKGAFTVTKADKKLWAKLVYHTREFFWVEDNYSVWRRYNENHFFKKAILFSLRNPTKIKKMEEDRFKKQMINKRKFVKKLSARAKKLVILANTLSESSDERKATSFRSARMWFSIAEEVERRSDLTATDVLHMLDEELKSFLLNNKVDRKVLKERQKMCLLVHLSDKNLMFSGTALQKVTPANFEDFDINTTVISGVVASPGIIKGRVRIVIKHDDIAKVKSGEVLVTNNTTPDYVPAMRKAAAIVTEQGGITSHAALLSRELGVPCVIGTKIATKVLKTGDRIEVDANRGIVRKL